MEVSWKTFLDNQKNANFDNTSITENSRMAYPLNFIEKRVASATGQTPSHVIFLTCDLYGVLPPVSLLTEPQSAFYFLMGYTAKLGSTEISAQANIAPTFSACFGAPFSQGLLLSTHPYSENALKNQVPRFS